MKFIDSLFPIIVIGVSILGAIVIYFLLRLAQYLDMKHYNHIDKKSLINFKDEDMFNAYRPYIPYASCYINKVYKKMIEGVYNSLIINIHKQVVTHELSLLLDNYSPNNNIISGISYRNIHDKFICTPYIKFWIVIKLHHPTCKNSVIKYLYSISGLSEYDMKESLIKWYLDESDIIERIEKNMGIIVHSSKHSLFNIFAIEGEIISLKEDKER